MFVVRNNPNVVLAPCVFIIFHLYLELLLLHSEHPGRAVSEDPAEVSQPGGLEADAGVVGWPHHQQLQELDRVDAGHDLRHQLGHDDHQDAGQETGLQEHRLTHSGPAEL